MHACAV
jgi:hypothetical protein